ncbi:TetR/AcrR family transcriptional regulator [Atopomonas hussainii]|uniref:TetR/AcrR family transcriptional regulator n=1 Tax=Atopomonas hussainii TaxID=1429083 RepID=UPI00090029DF|nr:TetR/AcrR family transcriptional regulator [Atopomonas hussainii]
MPSLSNDYHHGNLRHSLIEASLDLIDREGLEALSLRRLAEMVGVSRQAPYHHFRDKQALLAAIGERGFVQLNCNLQKVVEDESAPLDQRLYQAVLNYLDFALANPALYELMFGRVLWREQDDHQDTHDFQRYAKDCFRQYVRLFDLLKAQGLLPETDNSLRLAQLLWAAMHGLAKLASDGLFVKREDLAEIARYTLARFRPSTPLQ